MTGPSAEDVAAYLRALEGGLARLICDEHFDDKLGMRTSSAQQLLWHERHAEHAVRVTGCEGFRGWFNTPEAEGFWCAYREIHPYD